MKSTVNSHWKDWCGSCISSTLAIWCEELTHWKRPWCWERLKAKEKRVAADEMAGWHHWLDGFESEWTPGDGDGQGGLACCDSWGHKELDMTEQLNWSLKLVKYYVIYSNHSVTRSCLILCNPTDCSTPGLPEFAKVHVHCIGDVSQTSPCLLPCSPFASNLSQHQGLFQWVSSSHQMAK